MNRAHMHNNSKQHRRVREGSLLVNANGTVMRDGLVQRVKQPHLVRERRREQAMRVCFDGFAGTSQCLYRSVHGEGNNDEVCMVIIAHQTLCFCS
jgi:hypothetical protein